jgi:hypothetical protein
MSYIKKEPIIEFIKKGLNNPNKLEAFGHDAIEILAEIEYAPTADVVEVVRCKDCIHYQKGSCNHFGYYLYASDVEENDFCSYGERKQ